MKIEIGKRYKLKFLASDEWEQDYEGIGIVIRKNPPGFDDQEHDIFEVDLEDQEFSGFFSQEDFVEQIPTKDEEINNLKSWLKYIVEGPERSLWMDSRDDAADELVDAAERALSGENFEEYKKEYLIDILPALKGRDSQTLSR